MKIHENPGNYRKSMKIHENLGNYRKSMKIHENQWKSWKSMPNHIEKNNPARWDLRSQKADFLIYVSFAVRFCFGWSRVRLSVQLWERSGAWQFALPFKQPSGVSFFRASGKQSQENQVKQAEKTKQIWTNYV